MRLSLRLLRPLIVLLATVTAAALPARAADRLQVVTTFTILADMANEVAGGLADVSSLTKPGSEIHGYEPTPQDIVRASRADLILWNGLNLEAWFEKFFANLDSVPAVVLTEGIEPMPIGEGPYSGKPNPHAWMSAPNALRYVENIRAALARHDPANAAAYAANAEAYGRRIRDLDQTLRERLARVPADRRVLVTSEGAFSYWCRDYGFGELYLWPINADAQGTPRQIRAVIDRVRERGLPVVFSESTVRPAAARQVARETGARYGGVLYVDSLTAADGPAPTYLALLEANAATIVRGFLGEDLK